MEKEVQPLVTAAITTYNRDVEIVRRALASIVNQSYLKIEIIIVNDYPADQELAEKLRQMADEYAEMRPIEYIVVEKNGGACKARNIALQKAKGKYIAYLDDDDEWLHNKIELQVRRGEQSAKTGIVYCNSISRDLDQGNEQLRYHTAQPEGNIFTLMLRKNIIGSCSFPLLRTAALAEAGGFREDMPALQDWEVYLRILKQYEAAYVNEPLVVYYIYDGERISVRHDRRTIAFENMHSEFAEDLIANKKSASAFYLMGTYFYSLNGELGKAFQYYKMGVRNDPYKVKRNIKDLGRMLGRKFIKSKKV